jgi:uncharacterized protein (TIGR03546 family)
MLLNFLKPVRLLVKGFLETDSPRQLAAGLVLGMFLGLIPKGNLFAVAFSVLLLGTRANLVAGSIGAALFTAINTLTDPWAHRIGAWLLENPKLSGYWAKAYDMPLAPWTNFNNTVVLGSVVLGLGLAIPLYWFGKWGAARGRPLVAHHLHAYKVDQVLGHVESVASLKTS